MGGPVFGNNILIESIYSSFINTPFAPLALLNLDRARWWQDYTLFHRHCQLCDMTTAHPIDGLISFRKSTPYIGIMPLIVASIWWATNNINLFTQAKTRDAVISEIQQASHVFRQPYISRLAAKIAADGVAIGRLAYISHDSTQSDIARLNSIALGGELWKDIDEYRRYINKLDIKPRFRI